MFTSKGPAGMGFEVLFKLSGLFPADEGYRRLDTPGAELSPMRHLSAIMYFEAGIKIQCDSRVMTGFIDLADHDVNIMKAVHLTKYHSVKMPAHISLPGQASFSTLFRTKPGGGGGNRTRVLMCLQISFYMLSPIFDFASPLSIGAG